MHVNETTIRPERGRLRGSERARVTERVCVRKGAVPPKDMDGGAGPSLSYSLQGMCVCVCV